MKADPKHQALLEALTEQSDDEIRRRLTIEKYKDPDFIPSEVLVSLVRMKFGQRNGLLDRIASTLHGRILRLIEQYFRNNPQWSGVVNSSSETLKETASRTWVALLADKNPVSFAEVRFLNWLEARTLDFLRSQLALKNAMMSCDALTGEDDEGSVIGDEFQVVDDAENQPEEEVFRKQQYQHLQKLMMSWEKPVRDAVYYRLECEYDWDRISKLMGKSKPTVRRLYKIGMERLNGATK